MSTVGRQPECGCCGCFGRHQHAKPPREIPREEWDVPFFADPEEEMRHWNRGYSSEAWKED